MQFLGRPPGAAITIFPQVFDHQSHVTEMADACVWMPEPKTLRVTPNQSGSALHQFRRGWNRWRSFVQFIGRAGHKHTLRSDEKNGKGALRFPSRWAKTWTSAFPPLASSPPVGAWCWRRVHRGLSRSTRSGCGSLSRSRRTVEVVGALNAGSLGCIKNQPSGQLIVRDAMFLGTNG